jgi:hypothetical protein
VGAGLGESCQQSTSFSWETRTLVLKWGNRSISEAGHRVHYIQQDEDCFTGSSEPPLLYRAVAMTLKISGDSEHKEEEICLRQSWNLSHIMQSVSLCCTHEPLPHRLLSVASRLRDCSECQSQLPWRAHESSPVLQEKVRLERRRSQSVWDGKQRALKGWNRHPLHGVGRHGRKLKGSCTGTSCTC